MSASGNRRQSQLVASVVFVGLVFVFGPAIRAEQPATPLPRSAGWSWWISPFAAEDIWGHSAVWTGEEMIVWGGWSVGPPAGEVDTGGCFNEASSSWTPTSNVGAPTARQGHTAVWTGSAMIVWGGSTDGGNYVANGGIYDPASDSWQSMSTIGAPSPRAWHTAVWTGQEMIIWGGIQDSMSAPLATGARYNPATDQWTEVNTAGAPIGRLSHTVVWTGTEMIVWGGDITFFPPYMTSTGGRYNPETNTWAPVSLTGVPDPRSSHAAVWTGDTMVVWGGQSTGSGKFDTGGRYDPSGDSWSATDLTTAPPATVFPVAVWTGSEMVIWGGTIEAGTYTDTGAHYDPVSDIWHPTSMTGVPEPRRWNTAVWTGRGMIIWGGQEGAPPGVVELAVYSGAIFTDGFESGDTSIWSGVVPQ
jgi:hypothetical protein